MYKSVSLTVHCYVQWVFDVTMSDSVWEGEVCSIEHLDTIIINTVCYEYLGWTAIVIGKWSSSCPLPCGG